MVRNTALALLVAYLAAAISSPGCCRSISPCDSAERLCGPQALLFVCRRLGVATTLDEIKTLSGYDDTTGTTLAGLVKAAAAKHLAAAGYKIGAADVVSLGLPIIAHLWSNHFVVVEAGVPGTVQVTNSATGTVAVKLEEFERAYSGFALVVAKDASLLPKGKGGGPDLRLSTDYCDFGYVYQGDQTTSNLKCKNVGSADLTIAKVESSCSCVIPISWPVHIAPGMEANIELRFDSAGQLGDVSKVVCIYSNDEITPRAEFHVGGYVRSRRLRHFPQMMLLGPVRRSSEAVGDVYVPSNEDEPLEISGVRCDSPYLTATVSHSADGQRPGAIIRVSLKPGAPIGVLKGNLAIESNHPFEPTAEIPITATIKGNVDLDRDTFFLGLAKQGKGASCNVTISTVSKDPLKIGKIDNPVDCVTVEAKPKTEGREYILTATLKPDSPLGNIKGEVIVHTNDPDQPELKIPVYAYVEK